MQALLQLIKDECSRPVWQRATQMAKGATLSGRVNADGELEVKLATKGGMSSPTVTLSAKHGDWGCECPSDDDVCLHVAAAVIVAAEAEKAGRAIGADLKGPKAQVGYRFVRDGKLLRLHRVLVRGEEEIPVKGPLARARQTLGDEMDVTRTDVQVERVLEGQREGFVPRNLVEPLLKVLKDVADVRLEGKPVRLGAPQAVLVARVEDAPKEGFRLIGGPDPAITAAFENGFALRGDELSPVMALHLSERDMADLRKGRVFSIEDVGRLVTQVIPEMEKRLPVRAVTRRLPKAKAMKPRIMLESQFDGATLSVLPLVVYGEPAVARVDGHGLRFLGGEVLPLRDERAEAHMVQTLREALDLQPGRPVRLAGPDAVDFAERVRRFGRAQLSGDGLNRCFLAPTLAPQVKMHTDASGQVQRADMGFVSSDGRGEHRADPAAVLKAFMAGERFAPLIDGGWAELPAGWLAEHADTLAALVAARDPADGSVAARGLSAVDLGRVCASMEQPMPPSFAQLREALEHFDRIPEAARPSDLTAELRSYQKQGVDWLSFLKRHDMGGALLADDMGLGKTLQTICVLDAPALVVCPASVLHSWRDEIARFRPGLSVHTYHGASRALDPHADVTLTTYSLLRMDIEVLAQLNFRVVVLDEAQQIKNPDSQVSRAAFRLRGDFRIALTGTPVENRLEDLWSEMHFAQPGLLGGRSDFADLYSKPIMEGDARAAARLRSRIRPFLLRRLKKDVAKELPPRTDVVLRCQLDHEERAAYQAIHAATQKELVARIAEGASVMAVLEALLRMRQAACHRGLLPGQTAERSSKVDLLIETLDEVVAEGHKALVFSQWTGLLDRIEPHLEAAGVPFCRLDGSTQDREGVVKRFQADDGPPVMLISLRAGGTGLTLTAADHVFLLDPWWNPAVEDQAADRAHRIGQERPVLVHRLVAEGTVEERLLALQDEKRALAAAATDGAARAISLTKDDLLALIG